MRHDRLLRKIVLGVLVALPVGVNSEMASGQAFEGITVVELSDRETNRPIDPDSTHLVVFTSARGIYVAGVVNAGSHGGCMATTTGVAGRIASISIGLNADLRIRRHGLKTVCPEMTLRFQGPDDVRIDVVGKSVSGKGKALLNIPLRAMDDDLAPFGRHDIKGVRLGRIASDSPELGPLTPPGYAEPQHRVFRRTIGAGPRANAVLGRAAAAATTGWRSDVLYSAQFFENLEQRSTAEAFRDAVVERYGSPGFQTEDVRYTLWIYDVQGRPVTFAGESANPCRSSLDYWLRKEEGERPLGRGWSFNTHDLGPWGCSLIMELSANRGEGGVSGYNVRMVNGHAMAVNMFMQRIDEAKELMARAKALLESKPRL